MPVIELKRGRVCGSCKLCCKLLVVEDPGKPYFFKPGFKWCQHAGKGCEIYRQRPGACRSYNCAWLDGIGGRDDRPDRLGAVLDIETGTDPEDMQEKKMWCLYEETPGLLNRSRKIRDLAQLAMSIEIDGEHLPVCVVHGRDRQVEREADGKHATEQTIYYPNGKVRHGTGILQRKKKETCG